VSWSPPRLDLSPVVLPPLAGAADDLWTLLMDLAERLNTPWTLVGGQMVLLHGLEHARPSPRVSTDIDAVVDVRTDPTGLRKTVSALTELGLEPVEPTPEGVMHRYIRRGSPTVVDVAAAATSVDVLVPEGLAASTNTNTSAGGRAFPAPGATQALTRTELLPVAYGRRTVDIPRPSLLGAIVVKASAAATDHRDPTRHLRDLAFLCSLITDPFALAHDLTPKDRRRLRAAATKLDHDSPAWSYLAEGAEDGRDAWRILAT